MDRPDSFGEACYRQDAFNDETPETEETYLTTYDVLADRLAREERTNG